VKYDIRNHNGMITIHNPKSGSHATLRVVTHKNKSSYGAYKGKRTLQKLTGPTRENPKHWTDFAWVSEKGVSVFYKKRAKDGKSDWECLAILASNPISGQMRNGLEYKFETHCLMCNRTLTHPDSIDSRIGPICAGRVQDSVKLNASAIVNAYMAFIAEKAAAKKALLKKAA